MIAIVPMKEHSERVPGKNIRDFNGKPLFYWIIRSLLKARTVRTVIVNTDSPAIGDMVLRHYPTVQILYRPDYLRGDIVTGNALIEWTMGQIKGSHFLYTHSTNPLLRPETIDQAVEVYTRNRDYDSLFGVTRHQFRLYKADGTPVNHDPGGLIRSQDLEPLYEDNSNLYIFSRKSFIASGGRIGQRAYMFEIPKSEAIDIDTEEDWIIAEAVVRCRDGWK